MNFSNFVIGVFGIYVLYYAANFIYDAFIKADKNQSNDEEQVLNIGDNIEEEVPQLVEDLYPEQEKKSSPIIDSSSFVRMEVETQGIPFESLIADSKTMFSGVSF
ncbi:hypothetical protein [Bacteroides fragilis]|uniref:Transmembrane protein n=1 Tax=Bacteroides fragilis (strain YCH46) TaxID=295405 RepID=Q64MF3_BACFR|nr:hypothetical protein [Bacteroides fragilis]BAD51334.1 hypothetical protein BFp0007 [Bacteroides fragilis YCH46]